MTRTDKIFDCAIVGGGVIGLSVASKLAATGATVCVIDAHRVGTQASWAGAGIIPAGRTDEAANALQRLTAASAQLHPDWSIWLHEETGVHNQYQQCGGLYVASTVAEATQLVEEADLAVSHGVNVTLLPRGELGRFDETLADTLSFGYFRPDDAQIRNPRHLKALRKACLHRSVKLMEDAPVMNVQVENERVSGLETPAGRFCADRFCFAAGCWTGRLLEDAGLRPAIRPVRGQMVMLRGARPLLRTVVNVGMRYLVPRQDGRVLIGSTMEEAGFHSRTSAAGVQELLNFALTIAPGLAELPVEKTWAGLRPATDDEWPLIGRIPSLENAWIASGHFRNGLTLAPATAEAMVALLTNTEPRIDVSAFDPLNRLSRVHSSGARRPAPLPATPV